MGKLNLEELQIAILGVLRFGDLVLVAFECKKILSCHV